MQTPPWNPAFEILIIVTVQLRVLNHDEHEAKCRRCGASCHHPIRVGEVSYILEELHCRFLGREQNGLYFCTVYENRFELAPWCHTAADALAAGHLASDCPYAAGVPNHKGHVWAPAKIREKLLPIIRQKLIEDGLPKSNSPDSALKALNAGGGHWTYSEQQDRFVFVSTGHQPLIG